jgi:hypothetical protein
MSRSSTLRIARRAALFAAVVTASLAIGACASDGGGEGGGDDGETTTGKRVTFDTVVQRKGELTFTNDEGWSVTLTRALVSVGPVYYFEGEPIESATDALLAPPAHRGIWERASDLIIGTAHAHPGHYVQGEARGEMLTASSVDLVGGPTTLAAGQGVTGLVRSARFSWTSPAEGPFAADLGSFVVVLEGHATKEAEERWFRLEAGRDAVVDSSGEPRVDGCVFDAIEVEGNGTVTITLDPSVWIAGSDFAEAPEGAEGAPEVVPVGTQPFNAFDRGLKKGGGYRFTFTAK